MALDPSAQLLQLLRLGGGGGGGESSLPVSGIGGGTPLSGLPLGEQGFGLGGGGSLLGGGSPGGGGAGFGGGQGLDLSQFLAQLLAGQTGAGTGLGLTAGIGAGSLDQGFGAGGQLGPQQQALGSGMGTEQLGQSGLAGSSSISSLQTLLQALGLAKSLGSLTGGKPTPSSSQSPNVTPEEIPLPNMPPDVQSALAGTTPFGGPATIPSGAGAFNLSQLMTPGAAGTFDLNQLMTAEGLPSETSATLGAQGLGDIPSGGVSSGLSLPGLSETLGGLGILGGLGTGALELSRGHLGGGLGTLGGLGIGALFGGPIGAGIGGGVGSLLGGLFGGGGPSKAWLQFPEHLGQTLGLESQGLQGLQAGVNSAQSPADLLAAITQFNQSIGTKVGGFGTPSWLSQFPIQNQNVAGGMDPNSPYFIQYLPGATGTSHEGGQVAEFSPDVTAANQAILQRLQQWGLA